VPISFSRRNRHHIHHPYHLTKLEIESGGGERGGGLVQVHIVGYIDYLSLWVRYSWICPTQKLLKNWEHVTMI
jgi:hypothetical protein